MRKTVYRYLRRNWVSLLLIEILFSFFQSNIVKPVIQKLFSLAVRIAGVQYVTASSLVKLLVSPATAAALLVDALVLMSVMLLHLFCLIECMRASRFNRSAPVFPTIALALKKLEQVYRAGNFRMLAIGILFIPIIGLPLLTTRISGVYVPEFLSYYMDSYPGAFAAVMALVLLGFVQFRRWIYSMHFYCYGSHTAYECTCNSAALYQARTTHILTRLLLGMFAYMLAYALVTFSLMTGFAQIARLLSARSFLSIVGMSAVSVLTQLVMKMMDFCYAPMMIAMLSATFFDLVAPMEEIPERTDLTEIDRLSQRVTAAIVAVVAVWGCVGVIESTAHGDLFDLHLSNYPAIVAHRGDASEHTENTLASFQAAIDSGADMIELDVQQSLDGELIVFHDSTLSRLGGVSLRVNALNYRVLGSFPLRNGATIPTLEQALQLCQDQIPLNIEIKAGASSPELVEQVVRLVEEYGYLENCIITSSRYSALETVKQLNPEIRTGYIMSIAMGNFETMEYADEFSIESSFVNSTLVNRIHAVDKTVAAWTVNDAESILQMAEAGVDYVITDEVQLAQEVVYSQEFEESWMQTCYKWISSLIYR